jgi:hypothetical protein
MTWYIDLQDEQLPFEMPQDAQGRTLYVFNVLARKDPTETFLEEMSQYLTTNGITAQILIGGQTDIPTGDGPFITLRQTGGVRGVKVQGRITTKIERPGAQVSVRAKSPRTAKKLAHEVHKLLSEIRNKELVVPAWATEQAATNGNNHKRR